MNFLFRIPAWAISLLFVLVITPIIYMIYVNMTYNSFHKPPLYHTIQNFNGQFLLAVISALLIYSWLAAIIVRYCDGRGTAWLLIIPAIWSILFISSIVPFAIEEALDNRDLFNAYHGKFESVIYYVGDDAFFISGFTLMFCTGLLAAFCIIRLTYRSRWDWLIVPLQLLLLPVGILWLQPRLRSLIDKQEITNPEAHFIG